MLKVTFTQLKDIIKELKWWVLPSNRSISAESGISSAGSVSFNQQITVSILS